MKKKSGLFKVLCGLLLIIIVLTYFINGRQGSISSLALGDVFLNCLQSFYYFFDTILFILIVGGFYGILNRVPAYHEIIKKIVDKMEGKGKTFVIVTTVLLVLISAFTGLNILLLLVVPMIVSIILALGYDKLVAMSATVGGILIGFIGSIFLTVKDASDYYSTSYATIDKLVGLDGTFANALPRLLLLVVGAGLLVWYIVRHIKDVDEDRVSYELSNDDTLLVKGLEKKGDAKKKGKSKVNVWPLGLVLGLALVLLIIGYLPWLSLFEVSCFDDFHTWLTGFTFADGKYLLMLVVVLLLAYNCYDLYKRIKNKNYDKKFIVSVLLALVELFVLSIFVVYSFNLIAKTGFGKWVNNSALWGSSIFTTLVSGNFGAFGTWYSIGNFMMAIVLVAISVFALKVIYRVSYDELFDGFIDGVKKFLPAALLVGLAYSVLVCSYNNGYIETIITSASDKFGDNAIIHSLVVMLGSILNVDLFYTSSGVLTSLVSTLTEKANLNVYSVMFQSLYGLIQLVGPTSILLIVGLSYLEIPYKTWLKYIWRFIVELLIVILLILMIVSLL